MTHPLHDKLNFVLKRGFDLTVTALLIAGLLSWLFILVWIINRFFLGMSTLFIQRRVGQNGKPFLCYKFKTMRDTGHHDLMPTEKSEERVTRFGIWLRNTGLDELPQLLNVLQGQMSLIGPRPYMEMESRQLSRHRRDFVHRYLVKPGITGWAQVHGYKGRMNTLVDIEHRLDFDLAYIKNWNFRLDLQIFFLSIWQAALAVFGIFLRKSMVQGEFIREKVPVLSMKEQEA